MLFQDRVLPFTIVLLLIGAFLPNLNAQTYTQKVRGTVIDADTRQPLMGANLLLVGTELGAVTDSTGQFTILDVPLGRYQLQISYLGYQTQILQEVLVESGKEVVRNLELLESPTSLDAVEVAASRSDYQVLHPVSVKTLTVEESFRFPATFYDPARLTTTFAGVVNDNDQANGLSIRGNSPNGLAWRLEGIDIVNPNHTPNAGTFSDRVTQNGGGVNILSAQMLGTSQFYTGAFPALYGNVLSGVLDMRLRDGNNQKHEFIGQIGLIGIDLAAEGPMSSNRQSSYLVNYRYSTIGLLSQLGVELGDEAINFQDLSFHLTFPGKKGQRFTIFGIGGLSENIFKGKEDPAEREFEKDRYNIEFESKMGAVGMTYATPIGKNGHWRSTLGGSALASNRNSEYILGSNTLPTDEDVNDQQKIALFSNYQHKISARTRVSTGVQVISESARIKDLDFLLTTNSRRGNIHGWLVQPFVSWSSRVSAKLNLTAGLHYNYYSLSESSSLEPRASVQWVFSEKENLSFAYGLHSQTQLPQYYVSNKELDFTKAHHFVLGYERELSSSTKLSTELFYQDLFNVPVASFLRGSFSVLNQVEVSEFFALENSGTGQNYGIELSLQRFILDDYYFLANATYYESKYKGGDGIERDTRFNGNYIFNLTGGKEWQWLSKKEKYKVLGVSLRVAYFGGFRDSPIDTVTSDLLGRTVYKNNEAFTIKQPDYFRTDLRVYLKFNREKYIASWSLDIQNLTNKENVAFSYFDREQGVIVEKNQLGIIPILNYRIEF